MEDSLCWSLFFSHHALFRNPFIRVLCFYKCVRHHYVPSAHLQIDPDDFASYWTPAGVSDAEKPQSISIFWFKLQPFTPLLLLLIIITYYFVDNVELLFTPVSLRALRWSKLPQVNEAWISGHKVPHIFQFADAAW